MSWPAGSGPELTPDDDTFRFLALTYSRSHHFMAATNGTTCDNFEFDDGVTNGAEWYPVAGKSNLLLVVRLLMTRVVRLFFKQNKY